MSGDLITFGSHSFDHIPFSALSTDQIEREFRVSKEFIEECSERRVSLSELSF